MGSEAEVHRLAPASALDQDFGGATHPHPHRIELNKHPQSFKILQNPSKSFKIYIYNIYIMFKPPSSGS